MEKAIKDNRDTAVAMVHSHWATNMNFTEPPDGDDYGVGYKWDRIDRLYLISPDRDVMFSERLESKPTGKNDKEGITYGVKKDPKNGNIVLYYYSIGKKIFSIEDY